MFDNKEPVSYGFEAVEMEPSDPYVNVVHEVPAPDMGKKPKKKGKKKNMGLRIGALALSCALLGSVAGGVMVLEFAPRAQIAEQVTPNETDDGIIYNPVTHRNTGDKALTPKEVFDSNVNAVVGIQTAGSTTNVFGQETQFASSGSGFVISEDGYVITNHHVIDGAETVEVAFYDGTSYEATIIGSEKANDVALLKIDAEGLQAVSIGDSDELQVGDQVAAIGNPLGELTFTLTSGYVSALDRAINTDGAPINMLQTDAAINSGNSGGPLFDMNGNVIGITTAKYSGNSGSGASIEGIGFAIPINDVMGVTNDLQTHGYVTGQAYLGIGVKPLDPTTAAYYGLPMGVFVETINEDSCAESGGMKQGDIITMFGDKEIEEYSDLAGELANYSAGDEVEVTVYRGGQTGTLTIVLDEKIPEPEVPEIPEPEVPEIPEGPMDEEYNGENQVPSTEDPAKGNPFGEEGFNPFEDFFE